MNALLIFVVLVVIGFVLWVLLDHKSPSAQAVRDLFKRKDQDEADSMSGVQGHVRDAVTAETETHENARQALYRIMTQTEGIRIKILPLDGEIANGQIAMAKAKANNDRPAYDQIADLVDADLAKKQAYQTTIAGLTDELKGLQLDVDDEAKRRDVLEQQGEIMIAKSDAAQVSAQIHEAHAGLSGKNASGSHMAEAQRILEKQLARANASKIAEAGLTPGEQSANAARKYMQQAADASAPHVDREAIWNAGNPPASK